jgi:hypothetical protein
MLRCEPSVAAYQVEWVAMLFVPQLEYADLTPEDPNRKRLAIGRNGRAELLVSCLPVEDTCVEAYLIDPAGARDASPWPDFLDQIERRVRTLGLLRRPIGFSRPRT